MPVAIPQLRPVLLDPPSLSSLAPTGLTTYGAATAIGVTWNRVPGATSYVLERSTSGGAWAAVATGAATYYSDTGLVPGSVYAYRVKALAGSLSSAYSAAVPGAALAGSPALILWAEDAYQDTALTVPAVANGADVRGIKDRSGNNRHYTAANAANKATLAAPAVAGRPAIRANGTASWFGAARFTVGDFYSMAVTAPLLTKLDNLLVADDATSVFYVHSYKNSRNLASHDGTAVASNSGAEFVQTGGVFSLNASNRFRLLGLQKWAAWKNGLRSFLWGGTAPTGAALGIANLFTRRNGDASLWFQGDLTFLHLFPSDAPVTFPLALCQLKTWALGSYGITPDCLPAPANLTATPTSSGQLTLTWDAVAGAAWYNLYRSSAPCNQGPLALITRIRRDGPPLTYTDNGVTNGVRYWYLITASDATAANNEGLISSVECTAVPMAVAAALPTGRVVDWDAAHAFQDAAGTTPATTHGADVLRIEDLSGSGAHATTTLANKATLEIDPYDSRPAVKFDGTASWCSVAGSLSFNDFHWAVVISNDEMNVGAATQRVYAGDGAGGHWFGRTVDGAFSFYDAAAGVPDAMSPLSAYGLLEVQRQGTTLRVWWNGRRVKSPDVTVTNATLSLTTLGGLNGTQLGKFRFRRWMLWPFALTMTQQAGIWEYFRQQHGTPGLVNSFNWVAEGLQNFEEFPDPIDLANNTRLCGIGDDYNTENTAAGRAMIFRSIDGAKYFPIFATEGIPGDNVMCQRCPMLQLASGRVLWGTYRTTSPNVEWSIWYSDDNGDHWTGPAVHAPPAGYDWMIPYGRPYELTPGGTIYAPAYGKKTATGLTDAVLLQSTNGGVSYTLRGVIAAGTGGVNAYNETSIVSLGGGNWLAVIRIDSPGGVFRTANSTDNGATWSAPTPMTWTGITLLIAPSLLRLQSGNILLVGGARPNGTVGRISLDNGSTWKNWAWVARYPTPHTYGTYPNLLQRPDGTIECFHFDANQRSIVSGFKESFFPTT